MEFSKYKNNKNKRIYGLTGGIASGKSFVSSILNKLGAEIVDADLIAREVVEKGSPVLKKIENEFGKNSLNNDGSLNRKFIRETIIKNKLKRETLNKIIHPEIIKAENEKVNNSNNHIIIVDAALLIESNSYKRFEKIILVYVNPVIQIERLMKREKISKIKAIETIEIQMPIDEKKKYANFIIDNSNSKIETKKQVEKLYELL